VTRLEDANGGAPVKIGGIILSGGLNTRIRLNKAFLEIGDGPIIRRIMDVLEGLAAETIIVTNQPDLYERMGVRVVTDIIPQRGPLSGIHAGLVASNYKYNFVCACDMPFVDAVLIEHLLEQAKGYDVVVPRMGEDLQPLHAVYARTCTRTIEKSLRAERRKLTSFYDQVRVKYVDADRLMPESELARIFLNINTRQDYEQARQFWKAGMVRRSAGIGKQKSPGKGG
jgi:molybdopterin-guanine dinucleotide biosynthesis protein A